jgi:hypothetical protein
VEIHYNTNGTQYPEHAIDIWRHFKTVEIAFSIDDLGARFEYQRTNAEWKTVLDNISKFRTLREIQSNIKLQCCSTVNVFNIRYIDQLAQWIALQGFDYVYWNMLHEIWYFSISRLPNTVKEQLADHLRSADAVHWRRDFDQIIDFMQGGASSDGSEMLAKMRELDTRRNQNLAEVLPELANIIGYAKT